MDLDISDVLTLSVRGDGIVCTVPRRASSAERFCVFAGGGVLMDFCWPAGGPGWKGCPPEPWERCFMSWRGFCGQVGLGSQAEQDGASHHCLSGSSRLPVPTLQALSEEDSGKCGFGACYPGGV